MRGNFEAEVFRVCQRFNVAEIYNQEGQSEKFIEAWTLVSETLLLSIKNRPNSLVVGRFPIVLDIARNLASALVSSGAQKNRLSPTQVKQLSTFSFNLER